MYVIVKHTCMKHVTKIMIVEWNTGVFISYRREVFSAKTEV